MRRRRTALTSTRVLLDGVQQDLAARVPDGEVLASLGEVKRRNMVQRGRLSRPIRKHRRRRQVDLTRTRQFSHRGTKRGVTNELELILVRATGESEDLRIMVEPQVRHGRREVPDGPDRRPLCALSEVRGRESVVDVDDSGRRAARDVRGAGGERGTTYATAV